MIYKDPSPAKLKKARIKTYEKEIKSMLEQEFLSRRNYNDTYSPYMAEKLLQIGEQGGGRAQMMKCIEVRSPNTFKRWLEENQDFQEAYELAQVYCQAYLEEQLLAGSLGQIDKFNPNALKMLMSTRFPEYREANSKTEITINTNSALEKLDDAALNERIKQEVKRLGFNNKDQIEDGIIIEGTSEDTRTTVS